MRILLVLPIREGRIQCFPDIGLLYVGTMLEKAGHQVKVLDCPKLKMDFADFRNFVQQGEFDVVGFRCYSRDHNYVNHHATIVKRVNPGILTLAGGPHPSSLPDFVLSGMANIDFAWKAEAEVGLPRLLELFQEYRSEIPEHLLETIPGLIRRSKEEERVVINPSEFGGDLDNFLPDWELLEPETYPACQKGKTRRTKIWDAFFHICTTRGCPYPCIYCNAPNLSGRRLRHRRTDRVIEELIILKERYGASRFSIIDDEFTLDREYATSFCKALIDAKLDMKWECPNGVRLDSLYPDLLQLMEASGCEALCVGIESGNERVQKLIQKRVTVDAIRERANMIARCSKIKIIGYFMMGFLDETEEEIRDTINLACALPLVRAAFNFVIPIPGTALFDELLQKGHLKLDKINWDNLTNDQIAFKRDNVSGKRLLALQRQAHLRFYTRPDVIWNVGTEMLRNPEMILAGLRKLRWLSWRGETYSFTPMYLRQENI